MLVKTPAVPAAIAIFASLSAPRLVRNERRNRSDLQSLQLQLTSAASIITLMSTAPVFHTWKETIWIFALPSKTLLSFISLDRALCAPTTPRDLSSAAFWCSGSEGDGFNNTRSPSLSLWPCSLITGLWSSMTTHLLDAVYLVGNLEDEKNMCPVPVAGNKYPPGI